MTSKTEKVFDQYLERFGEPLRHPPLDYGQHCMTTRQLAGYGRTALKEGRVIDWSRYLAPLPPDCES